MSNKSSINAFSSVNNSVSDSNKSIKAGSSSSSNNEDDSSSFNNDSNSSVNKTNSSISNFQNASESSNSKSTFKTSSISSKVDLSANSSSQFSDIISSNGNNKYLKDISHNANSADSYFNKINSASADINKKSEDISSISNKVNMLNSLIGLNELTLTDNESINQISQAVAINIIKVNNQKIKALTAKNNISNSSFKVKFDYNNYLKAKNIVKNDVTGINTHMGNSNATFNQGINILNSHNSLITSYADQLSFDTSNANKNINDAKNAASNASSYQLSASSAYIKAHSLANHLSQQVINTAKSNANNTKSIAGEAIDLNSKANYYNQQVTSISHKYSHDSSIASANQTITNNLKSVDNNNQFINSMASNIITTTNQVNVGINVTSLGHIYQNASQAVGIISDRKDMIVNNVNSISSATNVAKSASSSLHAKQEALKDGATDYMPMLGMRSLDAENNTTSYVKYYKQGYRAARKGFNKHIYQLLSGSQINAWDPNNSSRIGFNNAGHFIKGINDARQQVIKNGKEIDSKYYNYGYDTCHKLVKSNNLPKTTKHQFITLKQSILLVTGFLIGSHNMED